MQLPATCHPPPEAQLRALTLGWASGARWCVLETEASAGPRLFFATWAAWQNDPGRPRLLHYVAACTAIDAWTSFDTCPAEDWRCAELTRQLDAPEPSGWRRLTFADGRILLTLLQASDPVAALRGSQVRADAIVLRADRSDGPGGFMGVDADVPGWKALARMCRRGTRLVLAHPGRKPLDGAEPRPARAGVAPCDTNALPASAQAAGFVQVQLLHGEVAPAELSVLGRFDPSWERREDTRWAAPIARECVVVGAGVAGAAAAASLARRGWQVTVLESGPSAASGASSLPAGVFAPAVSADDNPLSRLTRAGVRMLIAFASAHLQHGIDWQATGVLQRAGEAPAEAHAHADEAFAANRGSPRERQAEARRLVQAGLDAASGAVVWHDLAGWVRPAKLVAALLATPGVTLRCSTAVGQISQAHDGWCTLSGHDGTVLAHSPLVVIAAGYQSNAWRNGDFALQAIAGQVTIGQRSPALSPGLPFPVNGNGSFIDQVALEGGGQHWLAGATFERDAGALTAPADPARIEAAHAENLKRLTALLPALTADFGLAQLGRSDLRHWRGIRAVAKDRLPIVGATRPEGVDAGPGRFPGLWACTAMGSRGVSLALLCGELLASWLHQEPLPVPGRLANRLRASRFRQDSTLSAPASYAYSDKRKTNM